MFNLAKPLYPLLLSVTKNNPETAHGQMLKTLKQIDNSRHLVWGNWLEKQLQQSFCLSDSRLSQNLWGLSFLNPVGLAPGCDKEGVAAGMWANLGFGFAELGAVTLHGQPGNARPRLFRLPLDEAILNRLGANNLGAATMSTTLQNTWKRAERNIPIGINLCKSKITPNQEAASDYLGSFRLLKDWADYFVINVSSPNTPGLRSLQDGEQLKPILEALQQENQSNLPIFIKIAPDLDWSAISAIIDLAKTDQLAGIIATNTTIRRDGLKTQILEATGKAIQEEAGGISGAPVRQRSTEIIRFIWQETKGELPIIGVGGIFTAEDAWEKITAGACLVQLYTGWIYYGPWIIPTILKGLLNKLEKHGLSNINEAVGSGLC